MRLWQETFGVQLGVDGGFEVSGDGRLCSEEPRIIEELVDFCDLASVLGCHGKESVEELEKTR